MAYLPDHELEYIKSRLRAVVDVTRSRTGKMPMMVSINLRPDDEGEPQDPVDLFLLRGKGEELVYETSAVIEIDGTPNQVLRLPAP